MTLPASGGITLGQVAAELGIGLPLSLGDSRVLSLAGKSSLPISLSDLYGKSGTAPLSATASGAYQSYTSSSAGTGTSSAAVYPAGGSGGYTYAWTVVSNPGNATVGALNGVSVTISRSFAKNASGTVTVTFNVTVTDSQGHTVTVSNVQATIEWTSTL